jgi:hypothetical protein
LVPGILFEAGAARMAIISEKVFPKFQNEASLRLSLRELMGGSNSGGV